MSKAVEEVTRAVLYGTYRLWYIENGIMYFTDHFETQWADDANDAPYEHNAGTPYTWEDDISEEENIRRGNGHIRYLAFMKNWDIKEPCDGYFSSPYSVEDINKGAVAWLYYREVGGLMAGSTMKEAIKWCKKANVLCGELT